MAQQRNFVLLQGVCSPFFRQLGTALRKAGHGVEKINFNGGDVVYWTGRHARMFRDRVDELDDFLVQRYADAGITDQILFGDQRPIHRVAVVAAQRRGVRTFVYEEGYFRPHWVTLEREGVNSCSQLPRDPDWFRAAARRLGPHPAPTPFASPFLKRAVHDVAYHLACAADPLLFPGYRGHAPVNAAVEYAGFVRRSLTLRRRADDDAATIARLEKESTPFYFLPLQLNSDAQIREHSPFNDMVDVMAYVMQSFATHERGAARLVIKNHPLEMGASNYPHLIDNLERQFGLQGRIDYLETGDLNALLPHARGVVTVNSTVGALALQCGRPTITLGDPIYNLRGLTWQHPLDAFWDAMEPPDAALFADFRDTVIHTTQVNGGFYCDTGIQMAIRNSLRLLTLAKTPLEQL